MILLGGNIGDVSAHFARCRELIENQIGRVISVSTEIETKAWGFSAKELFLNQALRVETSLSAEELLTQTQFIEVAVGRNRRVESDEKSRSGERYASRVIDVDIITYGSEVVSSEGLEIPHARMHEREFVLRPMVEVAPEWRHPTLNMTTVELLKNVSSKIKYN